ncbi:MAG: DUF4188 domain-containing protein [Nocardioidaceae bacterium]
MTQVFPGRWTADVDDEVTVFLIGMRINRPLRVDKWAPLMKDMAKMQRHLAQHPEDGLLGLEQWFGRTTIMLSYWSSAEALQRFASDADRPHLEPWRRFRRNVGDSGVVGVWHETYVSRPGQREVVYVNMPRFGLGKATEHVRIGAGTATAKQRMASRAS